MDGWNTIVSFWDGLFSGAMLVSETVNRSVLHYNQHFTVGGKSPCHICHLFLQKKNRLRQFQLQLLVDLFPESKLRQFSVRLLFAALEWTSLPFFVRLTYSGTKKKGGIQRQTWKPSILFCREGSGFLGDRFCAHFCRAGAKRQGHLQSLGLIRRPWS